MQCYRYAVVQPCKTLSRGPSCDRTCERTATPSSSREDRMYLIRERLSDWVRTPTSPTSMAIPSCTWTARS
jgi:hypothetical protein